MTPVEKRRGWRGAATALLLLVFLVAPAVPGRAQQVGVLRSMRAPAFDTAVAAFRTELQRTHPKASLVELGLVEPGWRERVEAFRGPALLAVGSVALEALLDAGEGRPIGFTMVLGPRPPAGRPVAGAAMEPSAAAEIELIHTVLPDLDRLAGLAWRRPSAWQQEAAESCRRLGLSWRAATVASVEEMPASSLTRRLTWAWVTGVSQMW
ncbi:MAG: hypothetical protein D6739_02940 [Nitrospirae bacterium]|nr:MAG: hypothetical protein D6739_02940 [Nitrospirota bacterium]